MGACMPHFLASLRKGVNASLAGHLTAGYCSAIQHTAMRKPIVAANWKMNMTASEAADFHDTFRLEIGDFNGAEIVIAPPFTSIPKLSEILGGSQKVRLGAQNFYYEKSGAFTGEISATMLRELFVRYVIIGHSERRQLFGETDELINRKVAAALASELRPILCLGETLAERQAGREQAVLERQITAALEGIQLSDFSDLVIAYEPVWAIGTGVNATPAQAQEMHAFLRARLAEIYGPEAAAKIRIQYGGSVKPGNAAQLLRQPDIDGALVGGASLDPRGFAQIVRAAAAD
ncbi:MAG: triose-phosphate isomerase [Terrimicrobiaceae bacterium]|nr:triose-phosphate isomerase [Terrimicrobiaceae bacterium]